jgi:DNA-binding LacI/PurR family transcriptional regulator
MYAETSQERKNNLIPLQPSRLKTSKDQVQRVIRGPEKVSEQVHGAISMFNTELQSRNNLNTRSVAGTHRLLHTLYRVMIGD